MFELNISIHCPELALLAQAITGRQQPAAEPPAAQRPSTPAPTAPVSPAPVAAPSYTLEQLSAAGAALVQSGQMPQLTALLTQYGVQAVTQLPPEQYGAFAQSLRGLGAQL